MKNYKFHIWLVVFCCCASLMVYQFVTIPEPVESNILALLPDIENDPVIEKSLQQFSSNVGKKTIFLLGHENMDVAIEAAELFARNLLNTEVFEKVRLKLNKNEQQQLLDTYYQHRHSLLAEHNRLLLQQGKADELLQQSLQKLYNPAFVTGSALLKNDPLLLFPDFIADMKNLYGGVDIYEDYMIARDHNRNYVLVSIVSQDNPFSMRIQERQINAINDSIKEVNNISGTDVISAGMIFHTSAGTKSAKQEISTVGLGSLMGLLLLMLWVFRTIKPLFLCLIPIAVGFIMAFSITLWLFGEINILVLVLGTSLIGVSIDYSFHFFADQRFHGICWVAEDGLRRIITGMGLGLFTSVMAYLSFLLTGFPGLQQIAVYSAIGLIGAFSTVVCLFPVLTSAYQSDFHSSLAAAVGKYLHYCKAIPVSRGILSVAGAVLLFLIIWIAGIQSEDDIRLLKSTPASIQEQEDKIKEILNSSSASQFFLIEAATPELVLQKEEAIRDALDNLVLEQHLGSYQALSQFFPSKKKQQESLDLMNNELINSKKLQNYMRTIGFSEQDVEQYLRQLQNDKSIPLPFVPEQVPAISHLWLGKTERSYAAIILLGNINHLQKVSDIQNPAKGIHFIDKVGDISLLFKSYRQRATVFVLLAYTLVVLLFSRRYGFKGAILTILPPLIAVLVALGILHGIGEKINLFHSLALLLVLGIGIDYSLFLLESKSDQASTMLAITLSALTTILSFGLLALSNTPAIHAFGFIVLIGISVALLVSPLVCRLAFIIDRKKIM